MAQEFQYIDDILKEFYAPAIVNQVYKKAPMWAQIQKRDKSMVGRRVVIPVQTAFTEAVGSRVANNYTLPSAGRNTYDTAYISMKRIYGRIQVDGFSIESVKGKGGWVDVLTAETKGVANAFAMEVDRQSMGRGNCVLATFVSLSTAAVTIDAPHGIAGDTPVAKWCRAGMLVDGYDVNDYTKHVDSLTIDSITAAGVLNMSATTGLSSLADGDYICREDSFSSTPASVGDMMGIDGIVSDDNLPIAATDFEGISRSSYPIWCAFEDATVQVISENVIQSLLDSIEKRTDGESVNLALTTYDLKNKLIDIIRSDRQITSLDLVAGWKALRYVGGNVDLPIMVHKNCPVGYFYAIALPHITFYTLKDFVWDDKGGGTIKPVANTDAYESWFKMYANIGTDCSNAHGKLTGLTTS